MSAAAEFQIIGLKNLRPSKTNPVGRTDKKDLAELVASIRECGVLQPVVVRPLDMGNGYEIVCGHRRCAAAEAAGLDAVPAMVRVLSQAEALELQITENLQRKDVHPLDEADGYARLRDAHGYTVEAIASRVGKSRAYVYQRLALGQLDPEVKKLVAKDGLNVGIAFVIARIPSVELQREAASKVAEMGRKEYDPKTRQYVSIPPSIAQVREYVTDHYMLDMKAAPFNILDPLLVPEAGPCKTCPKRTANALELFDDLEKGADLCLDPACFKTKREADWKAKTAQYAARKDVVVLDLAQSERAVPAHGYLANGYVRTSDKPEGGKVTWQKKAETAKVTPRLYVARSTKTGEVELLYRRPEIEKLLAAATSAKGGAAVTPAAPAPKANVRDEKRLEFVSDAGRRAVIKAAVESVGKMTGDEALEAVWKALCQPSLDKNEREALGLGAEASDLVKLHSVVKDSAKARGIMAFMIVETHGFLDDIDELGINSRKIEDAAQKAAAVEYDKQKKAAAATAGTCASCGSKPAKGEALARVADPEAKGKYIDVCPKCWINDAPAKPAAKKGGKK